MTRGTDNDGIKCPYCKTVQRNICGSRRPLVGVTIEFIHACSKCFMTSYYWARLEITLEAEKIGKVK